MGWLDYLAAAADVEPEQKQEEEIEDGEKTDGNHQKVAAPGRSFLFPRRNKTSGATKPCACSKGKGS